MIVDREADNYFKIRMLDPYMADHKGYIAGGCFKNIFNGEKIKDVDVFFENAEDFQNANACFSRDTESYRHFYENANVTAYKHARTGVTVELCKSHFAKPEDMLHNFDFTIAKFAYYKARVPDTEGLFDEPSEKIEYRIMMDDHFFEHLQLKRLVVDDRLLFPMSTFERMIRYVRYGYMPCRETKLKIAQAIHDIPGTVELSSSSFYDGID